MAAYYSERIQRKCALKQKQVRFFWHSSDEFNAEYPASAGTVLVRPAGMMTGVTADESALIETQAMRIARTGFEGHLLQHIASLGIIFGHALDSLRIAF